MKKAPALLAAALIACTGPKKVPERMYSSMMDGELDRVETCADIRRMQALVVEADSTRNEEQQSVEGGYVQLWVHGAGSETAVHVRASSAIDAWSGRVSLGANGEIQLGKGVGARCPIERQTLEDTLLIIQVRAQ